MTREDLSTLKKLACIGAWKLPELEAVFELAEKGLAQPAPALSEPAGEGWIKCSERLPDGSDGDQYGNVLGFHNNVDMYQWYLISDYAKDRTAPITHWMPLPAAPDDGRAEVTK